MKRQLSVIIPAYNEGSVIRGTLESVHQEVHAIPHSEVIVVCDGSSDDTYQQALSCKHPEVTVLGYKRNMGKGHAVKYGVARCSGEIVMLLDADMEIHPKHIRPMLSSMREHKADVVIGSKRHPFSEVDYPLQRRLLSWGYQRLTNLFFRIDVRDTQVGLKAFRREVIEQASMRMVGKRFAFDLEMLVIAHHLGFRRIEEFPVKIEHAFGSSIGIRAVRDTLIDTLGILYRERVLKYYDIPDAGPPDLTPRVAPAEDSDSMSKAA